MTLDDLPMETMLKWPVVGMFDTLVVDNGMDFQSNSVKKSLARLFVEVISSPPREPRYKGGIERMGRTMSREAAYQYRAGCYPALRKGIRADSFSMAGRNLMAWLSVLTTPYPDESLGGYVIRLGEKNIVMSPSWLLQHMKDQARCPVDSAAVTARDRRLISVVESMAGLPAHSLLNKGFVDFTIGEAQYGIDPAWAKRPLDAYQRHHPMVCPACLEEVTYARKLWDLAHLPVCTQHGLALIDTCPNCGKRLSWKRIKVAHCGDCGADLRQAARVNVDPEVTELASLSLSHIPLGTEAHTELLSPEDLYRLVRLRALMKPGHGLEEALKENFIKLPLGDRLQALSLIAEAWNGRFLDSAHIRQILLENWRHLEALNANFHIRRELRRWVDTADLDDPVAGMILHDTPDADADKAYHLYSGNPPRFTDPQEIARFLGVEQPLLECLRWRYLLKYPTPRYLAYDADDVLECRDFLDDLMTPEEVDLIVGAPGISRMLEQSRLIEPWCRLAEKPCYAPDSLANLFRAMLVKVLPKPAQGDALTLGQLAEGNPDRLMELITRVLSGTVRAVHWAAPYRLVDLVVLEGNESL